MCISFFGIGLEKYKLVIAANRDEFIHRKALRAEKRDNFICGLDIGHIGTFGDEFEKSYGTWIGINLKGKFGFLTNLRQDIKSIQIDKKSRGFLVKDYISSEVEDLDPLKYLHSLNKKDYNGFNLIIGDLKKNKMYYTGNKGSLKLNEFDMRDTAIEKDLSNEGVAELQTNILYGISNGVLTEFFKEEVEWEKVKKGKTIFERLLKQDYKKEELVDKLLDELLSDNIEIHSNLPNILGIETEKNLSSICIECNKPGSLLKNYGTRTQTIILVDYADRLTFVERDRYTVDENSEIIPGDFRKIIEEVLL
ncbi:hypothetical protein HK099_004355 [Clydaea vesicula]|uniref:Uncharacterized protein n=1 Tax=Clydaea vesicula TaxID=447962 RepID=A0AAD5U0W4_9FUNG|nr:hypothetical protein HK099_004355 [Clydaea vesicula]